MSDPKHITLLRDWLRDHDEVHERIGLYCCRLSDETRSLLATYDTAFSPLTADREAE